MNPAVNAHRFELYVKWSLYLILSVPLVNTAVFVSILRPITWHTVLAALAVLISTAICIGYSRRASATDPAPRPAAREVSVVLGAGILSAAANWWWLAHTASWVEQTRTTLALQISTGPMFAIAVLGMALSARGATLAAVALLALLVPGWILLDAPILVVLFCVAFLSSTIWLTLWMLRVQRELQQAHTRDAQLGLAEERLRISRDLHDVFGRTLATISVKSELASELARRGRQDEAAAEMAQIRSISDDAGREVRRVVRGEIATSFGAELDGARALLTSAGITCSILVDGQTLHDGTALAGREDLKQSGPLGWVVRESVTNILRHSNATEATITVTNDDDCTTLTVANNGAGEASGHIGTGISSLRSRMAENQGSLEIHHGGGWFTLTTSGHRTGASNTNSALTNSAPTNSAATSSANRTTTAETATTPNAANRESLPSKEIQ